MSRFVRETIETDWKHGGQVGFERTVARADYAAMGDAIEDLEKLNIDQRINDLWKAVDKLRHDAEVRDAVDRLSALESAAPKKDGALVNGEHVVRWARHSAREVGLFRDGRWFCEINGRPGWHTIHGLPHWIGPRIDMPEDGR